MAIQKMAYHENAITLQNELDMLMSFHTIDQLIEDNQNSVLASTIARKFMEYEAVYYGDHENDSLKSPKAYFKDDDEWWKFKQFSLTPEIIKKAEVEVDEMIDELDDFWDSGECTLKEFEERFDPTQITEMLSAYVRYTSLWGRILNPQQDDGPKYRHPLDFIQNQELRDHFGIRGRI